MEKHKEKQKGEKMINTVKIKSRMVELGLNQKKLAKEMGISQAAVNQKINNIRPMSLVEAERLSVILVIKTDEYADYFFYS